MYSTQRIVALVLACALLGSLLVATGAAIPPPPPPPEADVEVEPTEVRAGEPFEVDVSGSSNYDTILWSVDNQTYESRTEEVTIDEPGTYTVEVTVWDHDEADTATATVVVKEAIIDNLELSVADRILEVGGETTLEATAVYTNDSRETVTESARFRLANDSVGTIEDDTLVVTEPGVHTVRVGYFGFLVNETIIVEDDDPDEESDGMGLSGTLALVPVVVAALLASRVR